MFSALVTKAAECILLTFRMPYQLFVPRIKFAQSFDQAQLRRVDINLAAKYMKPLYAKIDDDELELWTAPFEETFGCLSAAYNYCTQAADEVHLTEVHDLFRPMTIYGSLLYDSRRRGSRQTILEVDGVPQPNVNPFTAAYEEMREKVDAFCTRLALSHKGNKARPIAKNLVARRNRNIKNMKKKFVIDLVAAWEDKVETAMGELGCGGCSCCEPETEADTEVDEPEMQWPDSEVEIVE